MVSNVVKLSPTTSNEEFPKHITTNSKPMHARSHSESKIHEASYSGKTKLLKQIRSKQRGNRLSVREPRSRKSAAEGDDAGKRAREDLGGVTTYKTNSRTTRTLVEVLEPHFPAHVDTFVSSLNSTLNPDHLPHKYHVHAPEVEFNLLSFSNLPTLNQSRTGSKFVSTYSSPEFLAPLQLVSKRIPLKRPSE